MGDDNERQPNFCAVLPKLPILHTPIAAMFMDSPEHPSGTSTPPLQTSASVPFKWEEQPGKPRPCSDIITLPEPKPEPEPAKCLELPPCRMMFTKTPSPTTVLDGPYNVGRPKFSSFRFFRDGQDSFDSFSSFSPEGTGLDGLLIGSSKRSSGRLKTRGLFGKFKGGKREVDGGSSGFSPYSISSCESDESWSNGDGEKMRRNGSFSSVPHAKSSQLWTTICEGFKQVIQWKSGRKSSKQGQE